MPIPQSPDSRPYAAGYQAPWPRASELIATARSAEGETDAKPASAEHDLMPAGPAPLR